MSSSGSKIRSSRSRNDPLLASSGGGNSKRGSSHHIVFCLLPIVGGVIILGVLFHVLVKLDLSISAISVSGALAAYEPYIVILVPLLIAGLLMFVVTIARNIQLKVYFSSRQSTYSWFVKALNLVSAIFNILAYFGFIVLSLFQSTGEQPWTNYHFAGATVYFVCSNLYSLLQSWLLFKQTQYPLVLKLLFWALAILSLITSVVYVWWRQSEQYEWVAVVAAITYVMLFAILFHIDPVDDELAAFFCCRR
jgi:hypothetical protein